MRPDDLLQQARQGLAQLAPQELRREGLLPLSGEFVPSLYYPPLNRLTEADETRAFAGYRPPTDGPLTVYLHIPFCRQRCAFCHCAISTTRSSGERDAYLEALEREIDLFGRRFGYARIPARSILVGGGTPTDLSAAQLRRFLGLVHSRFDLSTCTQISCDVDVSTLLGAEGRERLDLLRDHGVRRLTIGAQSFDDGILSRMNRSHGSRDIAAAVAQAQAAGFADVGLDLIYGYPGQDAQGWARVLDAALDLAPGEVQIYRLKTLSWGRGECVLTRQRDTADDDRPPEDEVLLQKHYAALRLTERGYQEGLTRAFAREPEYVSHYTRDMCCDLQPTAGFGLTASSSYADRFVQNSDRFSEYYSLLSAGRLPIVKACVRNADQQLRWALVVPLKNWRVEGRPYAGLTGRSLADVFRSKRGRLTSFDLLVTEDESLRLTQRGRFFADQVCQQFYHPDDKPFLPEDHNRGELHPFDDTAP